MGLGITSTVFSPNPTCVASSNLWLSATRCNSLPRSIDDPDLTCTIAVQGQAKQSSGAEDDCFAAYTNTIAYTDCPLSYTAASSYSYNYGVGFYDQVVTFCCPEAYPYEWNPTTSTYTWPDGVDYTFPHQPPCRATSVEVLRSQIVTIKSTDEEQASAVVITTTTSWADDAVLFAEAESISAKVYNRGGPTPSTCWGNDCPISYEPSPTFPSTITPSPTMQFTPPPECLDPSNLWIVTTSCYITSPTNVYVNTPDWLQCTVTNFGPPDRSDSSCLPPYEPKTTQGDETVYYQGCPVGYSGVSTQSGPAYDTFRYQVGSFDISYYLTLCCPTEYSFSRVPIESSFGQRITTTYNDQPFGVWVYPMPGCYATSVTAQSGKMVPMHTSSNTMAWDKRQDESETDGFATTESWDYEHGTVYAANVAIGYTVFQGTHTCYESCSSWFTYYYPDGTGVQSTAASTTGSTTTNNSQSTVATITSGGNAGPTGAAISAASLNRGSWLKSASGSMVAGLVLIVVCT